MLTRYPKGESIGLLGYQKRVIEMLNETRITELRSLSMFVLANMATSLGIRGIGDMHKNALIMKIAYREQSNARDAKRTAKPFVMPEMEMSL